MDAAPQSKKSTILWFVLLAAVVFLWWYLRPQEDEGASRASIEADRIAAIGTDPDDILVDLRDDTSSATVAQIERDLGIDLVLVSDQSRDEQFYRAHVDASRRDAVLAALLRRGDVEVAEPDAMFAASPIEGYEVLPPADGNWEGFPNDPMYGKQWHLKQIGMPEAWKLADGSGVIVAVLDTGVAYETYQKFHQVEDLKGITFVKPYDFVDNDKHANDDHGHGTHVTGSIAQVTNNKIGVAGVARNVQIMPLKVLGGNGSGSVAGIADAIRYAADNGAKVINLSLGREQGGPAPTIDDAIRYAVQRGVFVAIASGNTREEGNQPNVVGNIAPSLAGAVTVGAVGRALDVAYYSTTSPAVELSAPGGDFRQSGGAGSGGVLQQTLDLDLLETFNRDPAQFGPPRADSFAYYYFQGTSMATPHVSGFAALLIQQGITTPAAIEEAMKKWATDKGPPGRDDQFGVGLINPRATLRGLGLAR
jgi:serine protease